jgi:lipopolysaccharide transport system ATP-binding protein
MSSDQNNIAIEAHGLGKSYKLGEQHKLLGKSKEKPVHWALDDVSFTIKHGEAVGIIGHNGAGKSTLLKLLSRITEPSAGKAIIHGRVASLLEVGTGFHPELTGRENIFMNGSVLGMQRSEIRQHFDEIIDFAGVEKFIDTPVKRYSSGMQMRLAFSVAAHLQPEILVVDEVLAVGDVQFQKKCMGKMDDVSRSGRTVLFVSHNMAAVRQLTSRCILMSRGKVAFDGDPGRAIELYGEAMSSTFTQGADLDAWPHKLAESERTVAFKALSFSKPQAVYEPDEPVKFAAKLYAREAAQSVRISGTIFHAEGYPIGSFFSPSTASFNEGETKTMEVALHNLNLAPGRYSFGLATGTGNETTGHRDFDIVHEVLPFEISSLTGEAGTLGAWVPHWGSLRIATPGFTELSNIHEN